MDLGHSEINPTSLFDLKAELHKKLESFKKEKLVQSASVKTVKPFISKTVSSKHENNKVKKPIEENYEEEEALKKSQKALEAKSKLYESIVANGILVGDEENEKYLVDFQRKVLYAPHENAKKEVQHNHNDNQEPTIQKSEKKKDCRGCSPQGLSRETHETEGPLHYQNVEQNEVRDYGTGYFAFSTSEKERKEQMEHLSSLRQETEEQRIMKQRMLKKRKAMLQARLEKICERRNIDKSVAASFEPVEDTDNVDTPQTVDLESIPLPETPPVAEKKIPKIRPWDVGKTDFGLPKRPKMKSQSDWIEDKRKERPEEFAPPSFYSK